MNVVEERELRAKVKKLEARIEQLERLLYSGALIGETEHGSAVYSTRQVAGASRMAAALLGPQK